MCSARESPSYCRYKNTKQDAWCFLNILPNTVIAHNERRRVEKV
ncbi:hypothetical protein VEx25_A0152 [Vibrio antiquarius]|uniref:Transposase n=1 Tax=Vibrio antiquarius (strain Ex25) TaxID=150340 RepID=A0ABM9WY10_VIBAE|nr:hypothetical protein VEx25_A0152 [Vibrio antiquarius]